MHSWCYIWRFQFFVFTAAEATRGSGRADKSVDISGGVHPGKWAGRCHPAAKRLRGASPKYGTGFKPVPRKSLRGWRNWWALRLREIAPRQSATCLEEFMVGYWHWERVKNAAVSHFLKVRPVIFWEVTVLVLTWQHRTDEGDFV